MSIKSLYPGYNVMNEKEEWDPHTRSIVTARLVREREYSFLTNEEAETLRFLSIRLVDDLRSDIIQYVLCHIDETLASPVGEGQRKPGTPPERDLIRQGIKDLNQWCLTHHMKYFFHLEETEQIELIQALSKGQAGLPKLWNIPQKELFNKLLNLAVESYCSHPAVWSEIGYGGPAYPRGYMRTSGDELDSWEAKKQK